MNINQRLGVMLGFHKPHELQGTSASNSDTFDFFLLISGIVTFTTGIILTFVRLFEPLFKLLVYKYIYQFWGEIYEPKIGEQTEEERQIANDVLSTFLTSSLNVELVYIMLTSITEFACQDDKKGINDPIKVSAAVVGQQTNVRVINLNTSDK